MRETTEDMGFRGKLKLSRKEQHGVSMKFRVRDP
jgi:hypothetical protein